MTRVCIDSWHLSLEAAKASARNIITGNWWIVHEPTFKRPYVVYSDYGVEDATHVSNLHGAVILASSKVGAK